MFKRELYQRGRTLHDQNYDTILVSLGQKCFYNITRARYYLRPEDVSSVSRKYCSTVMGFLVPTNQLGSKTDKKVHYEPLHRSFMEFAASFYLKSLSDKNQQEQLSQELEELFNNNNTDSVETLLSFALEMLAPDNACSDILSRIPVCGHRSVRRVSRGSVGGVRVMISGDQETRRGVDAGARLRLLHTSGYTPQNIGAVLLGLCGHEPVVETSDTAQVRGWTRILEHKPSLFSSLSLLWSSLSSCSMSQLNLGKLFENISRSSIRNILIDLTFTSSDSNNNVELEPSDQLRYTGHLLDTVSNTVESLSIKISDGVTVFPIIESLANIVKTAQHLTELLLDLELSSTNLSMITSALHKSKHVHTLKLLKVSNSVSGFKHLQNLIKCGKLQHLTFIPLPLKLFQQYTSDHDDVDYSCSSEYVYEDEALISEEHKLKKLAPILSKVVSGAGLQEKEVSPVEIVDGHLHPCLRYSNVYPAPLCAGNHRSGVHQLCQAVSYQHCKLTTLNITLDDQRDLLCLGDSLTTNTSLRTLVISTKQPCYNMKTSAAAPVSYSFPLLLGISCHIGLTDLDLSGLKMKIDSETLELTLSAFSSNTALSLQTVKILLFET